ncbi:MAG: cyclase family protein [Streptosporangiales bacterium]|nr:cyclase family protein [Streptosporangiales bacterium]
MTSLLDAIAAGIAVHDLGRPLQTGIPSSPNHPGFRMTLLRRHGDMVRTDGSSAANELIITGGHVGTHMDALAHVSHEGLLHGGVPIEDAMDGGRFTTHGADALPATLTRGVLLDVARANGTDCLPAGHGITPAELDLAAAQAGVEVGSGDVVLIRSGWGRLWSDAEAYVGLDTGVPGPTEAAANWLIDRRVRATGSDTIAYEQITRDLGHGLLPVHRRLLVDEGIPIIEILDLEGIGAAEVHEFCLVLAPLNVVGGTGAPVRPLAVVNASGNGPGTEDAGAG